MRAFLIAVHAVCLVINLVILIQALFVPNPLALISFVGAIVNLWFLIDLIQTNRA